ncbi:MAG: gamma-glutamyltransferase [Bryobacteraceae bacterium]|nr:gamma-glutamyltransferase [Bryobacteraceae bacterium]MDW8376698.1 gamma-glutamyltransferase [Bryobacterales bacterium]
MFARGLFVVFYGLVVFERPLVGQSLERHHARSVVIARQGIAATSQVLASQSAAQILGRGGSAVDAAIAANAVLGVTEPMMCGLGGDLFVLYWEAKSRKLVGLNASGWSPRKLTIELLKQRKIESMPSSGILSATVPGTVDGWRKMHQRYGRLPWESLFRDAIFYAEHGFPVHEIAASAWDEKRLSLTSESKRVFLPHGKAPRAGELFRNPDLARALRLIAKEGPETFYKGEIARAILRTSEKLQGVMEAADLADFSSEFVEPIFTDYRGWRVYELPPNGQGLAALQMLNMMELSPPSPSGPHSPAEMHKKIEAMKLAYGDLQSYVADPRFVQLPLPGLLSKEYAKQRAARIHPEKANCEMKPGHPPSSDTTYLAIVDAEGNIASWIQSISSVFGSGVVVEGMGFHLHNRGAGFQLDAKHPNGLAGRKRPFHTIIPGFLEKGDIRIGFGIMGGSNQPLAHAQFVSHVVDYGMDIQAALEAARFTKRNRGGCDVQIESRVGLTTIEALTALGHQVSVRKAYSPVMGRGNAVLHDASRQLNFGASDPRADGAAIPAPIP